MSATVYEEAYYGNAATASRFAAVTLGPVRVVERDYTSPASESQYHSSGSSPLASALGPVGRVIE